MQPETMVELVHGFVDVVKERREQAAWMAQDLQIPTAQKSLGQPSHPVVSFHTCDPDDETEEVMSFHS